MFMIITEVMPCGHHTLRRATLRHWHNATCDGTNAALVTVRRAMLILAVPHFATCDVDVYVARETPS